MNTFFISFSSDGAYAYFERSIQGMYQEKDTTFGDLNKIIQIDTKNTKVAREIAMPQLYTPMSSVVPDTDNRQLYFVAADFQSKRLGIGKLDLQSKKLTDFLQLDGVNFITICSDGKYLYATQGWDLYGQPKIRDCPVIRLRGWGDE